MDAYSKSPTWVSWQTLASNSEQFRGLISGLSQPQGLPGSDTLIPSLLTKEIFWDNSRTPFHLFHSHVADRCLNERTKSLMYLSPRLLKDSHHPCYHTFLTWLHHSLLATTECITWHVTGKSSHRRLHTVLGVRTCRGSSPLPMALLSIQQASKSQLGPVSQPVKWDQYLPADKEAKYSTHLG